MGQQYIYDFAAMQDAQLQLNKLINDLHVLQEKMQSAQKQAAQQWRGRASESFSVSCENISKHFQEVIEDLSSDRENLQQAIQSYQNLEGIQIAKIEELDSSNIF